MRIWSVVNQKGGVGKTTTAITLAGLAAEQQQRVLLVDLDPHGSLSCFFRVQPQSIQPSVFSLFENAHNLTELMVRQAIQKLPYHNISLLPAATAMASIERQPEGADGMGLVIANALALVKSSADLVIIDGPPMVSLLMVNAINAAQLLILPVQTEFFALRGLERMMETLALFSVLGKPAVKSQQQLIVPTLFDRRTHASMASLGQLREQYGDKVWAGQINLDTKFRDAMETGVLPHQFTEECSGVNNYRGLMASLLAIEKSTFDLPLSSAGHV